MINTNNYLIYQCLSSFSSSVFICVAKKGLQYFESYAIILLTGVATYLANAGD